MTVEQIETEVRTLALGDARCEIVLYPREGDEITRAILADRWTLPPHYGMLRALGAAGGRVLDLGAHVGTFALFAASLGCRVLAAEASPRNAALLVESAARNAFSELHVRNVAIAAEPGTVRFLEAGPYGFVAGPDLASRTIAVPATTVDRMLADAGWDGLDFVKMTSKGRSRPRCAACSACSPGPARRRSCSSPTDTP